MNSRGSDRADEPGRAGLVDRSTFLAQLHERFELPRRAVDDLVGSVTGNRIAGVQRLVRGDENEVYRAVLADGAVVFVRACFPDAPPGKASAEAKMMQQACLAGVPVPAVLGVRTLASEQGDRQVMVLEAAAGIQLAGHLPALAKTRRATVMRGLGVLLRQLETVRLPGPGRPDADGCWPDPVPDRSRYLAAVRRDSRLLDQAGLSSAEITQIGGQLDTIAAIPVPERWSLCHGDISVEHLFIGADQTITGLIDWGMWSGGTIADDLAALFMRLSSADFATVLSCHAARDGLRRDVAVSVLTQGIGGLAWIIRSGQSEGRIRLAAGIRWALEALRNES